MSDKMDLIYDLLKQDRVESSYFRKEVRASYKDTSDKLSKLSKETSERLTKIEATNTAQNVQLDAQTTQLGEHMRRTGILEDLYKDADERIEVLEEPGKVRSKLKKWLIVTATVAGAILTISKFLGLF